MDVLTERRVHRRPYPHLPAHAPGTSVRALGTGVITGAADDDPSAIGTYASAGAAFGPAILWAAPVMFPMMAVTLYLAAKIGKVTGMGLAAVLRVHYPRWLLLTVAGVLLVGNTIEAAADLFGLTQQMGVEEEGNLAELALKEAEAAEAVADDEENKEAA